MKRFILAAALISLIFCTSGCVKTSYNIKIDKKNNITISETEAYNQKLFKSFAQDSQSRKDLAAIDKSMEADKENLKAEGYDVVDYDKDGFKGLTIKKDYPKNSLKASDLPKGFSSVKESPITIEKGFLKTQYHISVEYDANKAMSENTNNSLVSGLSKTSGMTNKNQQAASDSEDNKDAAAVENNESSVPAANNVSSKSSNAGNAFNDMMSSLMDTAPELAPSIDLTITIPYKATKSNATKAISDTEYFWQLKPGEKNSIYVDYEKYNYVNIIVAILFAIIFIFSGLYYKKFMNTSSW